MRHAEFDHDGHDEERLPSDLDARLRGEPADTGDRQVCVGAAVLDPEVDGGHRSLSLGPNV